MLGDDIYLIERYGKGVGVVRESIMIAGAPTYSIFLETRFMRNDPAEEGEYFLCDTHNPKQYLLVSSFDNLVLVDANTNNENRWISSPFADNWTGVEDD